MQQLNRSRAFAPIARSIKHRSYHGSKSPSPTTHQGLSPAQAVWMRRLETHPIVFNAAAMTTYLAPLVSLLNGAGRGWVVTDIELLDYKPGQRGLFRYELAHQQGPLAPVGSVPPGQLQAGASGNNPCTVFGKIYADPGQLARVDRVLRALWEDAIDDDAVCAAPQPLGVIPELSMLVYVPVEGQFLDEVTTGELAADAMEWTASWLGALHRRPLRLTKHFRLADELASLATWATVAGQTYPDVAPLAQHALAYLQQRAAGLVLEAQTPIHKDFHYRHVLVARGVKVIDFDEVRLGDPNFDLAHFCANLHLLAYRRHGSPHHLYGLEQRFLDAYARSTGWNWSAHRARFTYFYVYTCLKVARQLCLGFGPSPVPIAGERYDQVRMILNQAAVAIAMGNG